MMSLLSKKLSGSWHDKIKSCQFLFALSWKREWGRGGGKRPKRVIKIMKIASPCQVDVCNGLKLPAIKVKLPEKLLPGRVWNKRNVELPQLVTSRHEPFRDREHALQGTTRTRHAGTAGGVLTGTKWV